MYRHCCLPASWVFNTWQGCFLTSHVRQSAGVCGEASDRVAPNNIYVPITRLIEQWTAESHMSKIVTVVVTRNNSTFALHHALLCQNKICPWPYYSDTPRVGAFWLADTRTHIRTHPLNSCFVNNFYACWLWMILLVNPSNCAVSAWEIVILILSGPELTS